MILKPGIEEIQTFLFIAFFESVAIGSSSLDLNAYTQINFIKALLKGDDYKFSLKDKECPKYSGMSF